VVRVSAWCALRSHASRSDRFKFIFRVAISLLKLHRAELIGKPFDVIVTKLKNFNQLDVDVDQFVELCLECKISDKDIEKLRSDYQTSLQQ
jgi:hypothetical protein